MRVLGVDFSYKESNMLVSICRLSNENLKEGIDLECITTFKAEKDYDLAGLVISQVNNLNVDYVVVDFTGVGRTLYNELCNILGDKVIGYKMNIKNDHNLINRLTQCPLLDELGLKLNYKMTDGYVVFDTSKYRDLEYLQVKSLALANYHILEKLFNEDDKVSTTSSSLRDISTLYIKDGIIVKNRCGIIGEKLTCMDIIDIIKKEKGIITIQEKGEIRSYINGERMIIFG